MTAAWATDSGGTRGVEDQVARRVAVTELKKQWLQWFWSWFAMKGEDSWEEEAVDMSLSGVAELPGVPGAGGWRVEGARGNWSERRVMSGPAAIVRCFVLPYYVYSVGLLLTPFTYLFST